MTGFIVDTDDHKLIRETVASIVESYGKDYYLPRSFSHGGIDELWGELGAAGLLGVHLPEQYGGGGGGLSESVIVIEELAAHGMPILNSVISPGICGSIIAAHGSDAMKAEWLPGVADGSKKIAFALTEPDAGSNSHNVATVAKRDSYGWVISGSKYYISAIDEADAVLLVARDGGIPADSKGRHKLTLFLIPLPAAGLEIQKLDTVVVSPDQQSTVFFESVHVGPESLIGEQGKGLYHVFAGLNPERILAAALSNGIGRYAVSRATDYAKGRSVWGVPIGSHQGVSHPLALTHIEVETSRLATWRAAQLFDTGGDAAEAANMAKFVASEASLKALDQSIQAHGGNGLAREYGLADLWFIARLMRTAPVSREMVLNFVSQTVLGLPASY
jgi:alkylation response protein AidB-like acyl-CoA dehydrogenase